MRKYYCDESGVKPTDLLVVRWKKTFISLVINTLPAQRIVLSP